MEDISIIKMEVEYPYIFAEFEDGIKKKYNVIDTLVPRREEYKKLLNREYFSKVKLSPMGWALIWDNRIDTTSDDVYENGEIVE